VVTVPQGPDQDAVLWARFADTVGIPAGRLRTGTDLARRLDALAATEAARLLNVARPGRLPVGLLAAVEGPAPALLEEHAGWVGEESERLVTALKDGGYDVVGDVTELRPAPAAWTDDPRRMHPVAEDVVTAQTTLLAGLLSPAG
jgi:hypothetical protein